MPSSNQTYDFVCFTDLAYEFTPADKKAVETKIKRRLKYHKLGAYDQARVDYIRKLKDELAAEISKMSTSKYYKKSTSEFADSADFDMKQMTADFVKRYDKLNQDELAAMIHFAIYLLYLR